MVDQIEATTEEVVAEMIEADIHSLSGKATTINLSLTMEVIVVAEEVVTNTFSTRLRVLGRTTLCPTWRMIKATTDSLREVQETLEVTRDPVASEVAQITTTEITTLQQLAQIVAVAAMIRNHSKVKTMSNIQIRNKTTRKCKTSSRALTKILDTPKCPVQTTKRSPLSN
jgi:uncharacterized protein (DUF2252 family)